MALGGSPELAWIQAKPSLDDVGTEFGEGGEEVSLVGSGSQGDQRSMLSAEDAFQGVPLFDAAVVRAAGLIEVKDPAPVDRVVRCQGENAEERSPELVTSGGQGFADTSDDHGVFPFHPARWVAANALDGPETGWAGIGQVSLDVPIGQGSIDQHIGDACNPFGFSYREHGELRLLAGTAHGGDQQSPQPSRNDGLTKREANRAC